MENFVVSARKYRPTGFDEVVGQEHITTTLKNAIDNSKLAQALLFCGPRGVGKTTCARIVARLINGFEEKTESNHLNIFELDAASNNSVEDIRNLIDQVRYPPQFGKFKVYIIDEVHMLSNAAFNAFLKTLEEPPSYAIFILATTEKHKVIPTILSRCQIFDFNRIQISNIANHLKSIAQRENIPAEDEALHLISQKADGALRDALSIFDLMVTYSSGKGVTFKDTLSNLHILDYDYYFKVIDSLLTQNHTQPLLIFDEVIKKGFDGHNFIVGLSEHIRNILVSQDARTVQLMEVPDSVKKKYVEQAQTAPASLLLTWLNIANQCDISYKASKNQRLSVELALMKMAHISHVLHPDQLSKINGSSNEQAALKKKLV
jgi:DNA polymerase-3 subunit gamma/tau